MTVISVNFRYEATLSLKEESVPLGLNTHVWKRLPEFDSYIELNLPVNNDLHINKENLDEILNQSPQLKQKWKELEDTYPLNKKGLLLWFGYLEQQKNDIEKEIAEHCRETCKQRTHALTPEELVCRSLLRLTDEQVNNFKARELDFIRENVRRVKGDIV